MEEIWKDIPDFNGYQASNLGRIRTFNKTTYTKFHGVRHWQNRILKQKITKATRSKNRYDARVCLWRNGKEHTMLVARCVAMAFLGKSDLTVNHIDGNSLNNCVDNLEWITRKENIQKGFKEGLFPQKKIKVLNKETNEEVIYPSLALASRSLNYNSGYFSNKSKKGIFENFRYKWTII